MANTLAATESSECLEEITQRLCSRLYEQFDDSVVLARCYVTVPFAALPERNARWVRDLAEAKGVAAELTGATPVISLAGTAGRNPLWNSRVHSQGHVGIPMVSASFIDAIPMMSRLMASLGGNLSWIDSRDTAQVVSLLGSVSGVLYVAEAATELDARGRKVIPASDFVEEYGVRTVFGTGGAFNSGQIFVLLVFCSETIPLPVARAFQRPLLQFKSNAARLLKKVFSDGESSGALLSSASGAVIRRAGRSDLPVDPVERAARLAELLDARDAELQALNGLYLKLESDLEERTRSLRTILDTTSDGFVLVDLEGSTYGETTSAVEKWFGPYTSGKSIAGYLFASDPEGAQRFRLGFSQISDQLLPFDVAADQMPKGVERDGRSLSLEYMPVQHKERLTGVLVIVRDRTAALAAVRAEQRARELQMVMTSLLRDRRGFARFVNEIEGLLARISAADDIVSQRRDLHTIKGSTAVGGFQTFADLVDQMEDQVSDSAAPLNCEQKAQLLGAWKGELSTLAGLAEFQLGSTVEISLPEYDGFVQRLTALPGCAPLVDEIRRWRFEPAKLALSRLAIQATRIAERLSKRVDVRIDDGGLRFPPERMQDIWSGLLHVVRNAVDHGIEPAEQRTTLGKPGDGIITLSCSIASDAWVISVGDDGSGIDWDAVRYRAAATHIDCGTEEALTEALFRDGFTTRLEVGEVSGRGVGLPALRAACSSLGANVHVSSKRHCGTVVRVSLPLALIETA